MQNLLNDLHLYELVLLFLGIFLFLILSAGLLYYIIKKEEIKRLLLFFPIPILMIGYPSVQEITISSDKIAFSKYQEEYIQNPNDTVAKQKLEQLTEKLEERAQTPEDILQISKAKLLLGNNTEAIKYADKAIKTEKERSESDSETSPAVPDTDDINTAQQRPKTTNQAIQLKQLAHIQNMESLDMDTATLKAKIKNVKVDDELIGAKQIVKRKTLEKLRTNN
ncbi:hypothetical protein [Aquimarina sp. 2201CG14-23]|uniref:hypothetical protein n=1 Tax=Aquimarina mycalae TaxID=3040073 RepID=UPI002477F95C|nr:hypothetical protein [Aquimarina sp. 2201CG14-23]MDH7444130.1 hypothetical protein [Aquimarina sp. 2201CG14-23]